MSAYENCSCPEIMAGGVCMPGEVPQRPYLKKVHTKDCSITLKKELTAIRSDNARLREILKVATETLRHMVFEDDDNKRWYSEEASRSLAQIHAMEKTMLDSPRNPQDKR